MNRRQRRAQQAKSNRTHRQSPLADQRQGVGIIGVWFTASVRCLQTGQWNEAVALCDQILAREPQHAEVHCNRGVALAALGRAPEAEAAYRQAIAVNPALADAYNNLGILLCKFDRHADAEPVLREAVRLRPQGAECHINLAAALKALGRFAEAEAVLRRTLASNPDHPEAHANLGETLRAMGRLEEAETALRHALTLRPDSADALCKLGATLRERRRIAESEAACRAAIALDPNHATAYCALGNTLENLGRFAEAETAYRRAIALAPTYVEAFNNLGMVMKNLGRLDEARALAEQAVHAMPMNGLHRLNLSELKRFREDDPAVPEMEALARNGAALPLKQRIELNYALAKAYEDIGRYDDAFRRMAAGSALKRAQSSYDEAATLKAFADIRATFTPTLFERFAGAGEPATPPVFVIGMPRSGTTLVEQILASHPAVFGAGELGHVADTVAALKTDAGKPRFPNFMPELAAEDWRALGANYLAATAAMAPDARFVVDKMPSNFFFVGVIHLALPNARIIHVTRDPLDTCLSCFSRLFAEGQHFSYDLAELGRYYNEYRKLMEHWRAVLPPGRILDVSYEDVVADLEGQTRRLLTHCDLDFDPRCLAFNETQRQVRTASATQVRQPLYRHAVGRAQVYLAHLAPLAAQLSERAHPPD